LLGRLEQAVLAAVVADCLVQEQPVLVALGVLVALVAAVAAAVSRVYLLAALVVLAQQSFAFTFEE